MKYTLSAILLIISMSCFGFGSNGGKLSQRSDVNDFINYMTSKYQFNKKELASWFDQIHVNKKILHSIAAPMEKKPWYLYRQIFMKADRIEKGAKFWHKHKDVLQRAEKRYGVPAKIIVAILGVETKYGAMQGNYKVLESLSTLAFNYPPRSQFFRTELKEFLLLTREQHLNPLQQFGSYAGAIGQPQFMPSSYRHYAVDFTGNGNKDLVNSTADSIGSIANYLKQHGWHSNELIVAPAQVSKKIKSSSTNKFKNKLYSIKRLEQLGIKPKTPINKNQRATLLVLQGQSTPEYWFSFNNFRVIKRYNTSDLYAMTIYQLSDSLEKAYHKKQSVL